MGKTIINIQNEANVNAEGKLNCYRCKPVICLETGAVFTSITDAAENAGVHKTQMSKHLCGELRTVKGKHYCYLSRSIESLNAIVTRLRETSSMEDDARKWREYQAEQERKRQEEEKRLEYERKVKEKREFELAKARDKAKRRKEIYERQQAQAEEAKQRYEAAVSELAALENNDIDKVKEIEEEVA